MEINRTLWQHLPPDRRRLPKDGLEKGHLIALALENVYRRIRLDHPEDILTKSDLVSVASDLWTTTTGGHFSDSDLDRYLEYGLLVPRYRVKPRCWLLVRQILTFSPDGLLQKVEVEELPFREKNRKLAYRHPEAADNFPPFQGQILGNPPPISPTIREAKRSTSLFTFSQVGAVLALHRTTWMKVDLLSVTPEKYAKIRNRWLANLKECLERAGRPKFCANLECSTPLPLGRQHYCSPECKGRAIRARKPKSTSRVARSYQRRIRDVE